MVELEEAKVDAMLVPAELNGEDASTKASPMVVLDSRADEAPP